MDRRLVAALRALFLLVALGFGTGCVTTPNVRLRSARIGGAGPQGLMFDTAVQVDNDNSFDIQLRAVRCSVVIEDRFALPPIVATPNTWLRAGTSTVVRVPMWIPFHMVQPLLATTLGNNEIHYRIVGRADVTATSTFRISYDDYAMDEDATINRGQLAAAAINGVMGRP